MNLLIKNSLLLLLLGCISCWNSCTTPSEQNTSLFQLRPAAETGVDFVNLLAENDTFNIIQYLYYYNGGGVAIGDVNQDSLPDIFFTANRLPNRLYLNKGNFQFEDVSEIAGIGGQGNWSTGVNMIDINADGWLDIYVCQVGKYKNFEGKNQLFINQKDGTFKEQAAQYRLDHEGFSTQSAFLDYDLDGDLDMYLLCHSVHSTATYQDTSKTRQRDERAGDKLYRNDGTHFTEVTQAAGIYNGVGGYGLGIAVGDINQDGCPDIYIGNDFHENDFTYINNCDGTFSEKTNTLFGHTSQFSMGNDLADFNNDGLLDVLTMDMKPADETIYKSSAGIDPYNIYQFKLGYGYHYQFPRNMLQLNTGKGFSEIAQLTGIAATDWSWSALLADFDNDGWKDVHITNGIVRRPNDLDYLKFSANQSIQAKAKDLELAAQMPDGKVANAIFKNNHDWTFSKKTTNWGMNRPSISNGAAYADLDLDGDLDMVVNNINEAAFLYENQARQISTANYLTIRLKGTLLNPFGIGAKVTIYTANAMQYQAVNPVRGWQSSVDYPLHFGLNQVTIIDSIRVTWLDGKTELLEAVATNQRLTVDYKNATLQVNKPLNPALNLAFKEVTKALNIDFQHQENRFSDLNRERLMPYLLSTQGPKVAVGDVNKDGLEDFFIGGASKQAGVLFIQQKRGTFIEKATTVFELDAVQEDIATLFFDADQDGDLDLYIGSGGNEFYQQNVALKDRLYKNDGMGNFTKDDTALPSFFNQTSCVLPADIDQDGDLDLFVGSRSIPVNYGLAPNSYLLLNDGKGQFIDATQAIAPALQKIGMVTDATWSDIDGDKDVDLIVVGEWMSIKIFDNQQGKLTLLAATTPNSEGLWNCIQAADIDQDGDEDFILGNWGLNSNLQATPKEPIRLYIKDFDKNLSKDAILTYFQQGKEYSLAGLDELGSQLVYLKKNYRQYKQFANHTFRDVFPLENLKGAIRLEAFTLESAVLLNKGNTQFELQALPTAAQIAPVHSILTKDVDQDGQIDVLLGGNFHEVQPAIGKMDASYGTFLKGHGDGTFKAIPNTISGIALNGQVRDIVPITINKETYLLVARNNGTVQVFGDIDTTVTE